MGGTGTRVAKSDVQLLPWCRMDTPWPASITASRALHLFRRRSKIVRLPCVGFAPTLRPTTSIPTASAFGDTPQADIWRLCSGRLAGVPELEGTGDNMQYSTQVQAVCDVGGPADLLTMTNLGPRRISAIEGLLGAPRKRPSQGDSCQPHPLCLQRCSASSDRAWRS